MSKQNATSNQQAAPVGLVQGHISLLGGLGERLFRLLAAVDRSGSINQAAKEVGLTYKGAWEMIERANNLAPNLLVMTVQGGRAGGGTKLTPAGKSLLQLFSELNQQHSVYLTQLNQRLLDQPDVIFLFRRLIMKASARNQFFGKVTEVLIGSVNATVSVMLKGGETLVASMTKESVQSLGIKTGSEVIALVKAPQVIIVSDFGGYRLSARNQLNGVINHIQKGSVNSEVVLGLTGGNTIIATVTNDSIENLGLVEGGSATAVFKAGAVLLGVAG